MNTSDEPTKLVLIKTAFGDFNSFTELQEYASKQFITLQNVLLEVKKLQEENEHLRNLLEKTTQLIEEKETQKIIKSPAEVACELQINRLQEEAMKRELTLEEVKKLDLLVKNKRLMEGDSTVIEGKTKKLPTNISEAQLIQIAAKRVKDIKNNDENS